MLARLISIVAPPLCVGCGADAGRSAPLCRACRAEMRPLAPAGFWGAFAYDGPAGAMVRAMKFGARAGLADVMAAQLAAHAPLALLDGPFVPVPVHRAHARRRGIDHSCALATALATRLDATVVRCLERSGDPTPQVGRGRRDRRNGPPGRIGVRAGAPLPLRAVLVDDVITTGATLRACASALEQAGCREIAAVAYARTIAQ